MKHREINRFSWDDKVGSRHSSGADPRLDCLSHCVIVSTW